jgi:hypothetical protein
MRSFLLKSFFLLVITVVPYLYIQYNRVPAKDSFYWKMTSPASSLILGGSRALKGISPSVLEEELMIDEVVNFAFTALHSPFGNPYYQLIKRKIQSAEEGGIFILSVTPASMMDYADSPAPREENYSIYKLFSTNSNPNWEYLIRNPRIRISLGERLFLDYKQTSKGTIIHSSGWEESPSHNQSKRTEVPPKLLKQRLLPSEERELYLEKIIELLQQKGQVILVRLPISDASLKVENHQIRKGFDTLMQHLADKHDISYLNLSQQGEQYTFVNGHHHLDGQSARKITKSIVQHLKKSR